MPQPTTPFVNFMFQVEISGMDTVEQFSQVLMPDAVFDVVEYRQGNDFRTRKLPGRLKYGNIVLKRGVTSNNTLYEWFNTVRNGNIDRRSGSIILLNQAREEVKRWNFYEAWPVRYKFPDLDAEGNQEAIEIVELVVEHIEIA